MFDEATPHRTQVFGVRATIVPAVSNTTSMLLPLGLSLMPVIFNGALSACASSCLLLRRIILPAVLELEARFSTGAATRSRFWAGAGRGSASSTAATANPTLEPNEPFHKSRSKVNRPQAQQTRILNNNYYQLP
jgi:hypothetical protein